MHWDLHDLFMLMELTGQVWLEIYGELNRDQASFVWNRGQYRTWIPNVCYINNFPLYQETI